MKPSYIQNLDEQQLMDWVRKVATRFVQNGLVPEREREDLMMTLFEKFWSKKEMLIEQFKGNSKFSTYCIAILNRMCLEQIRNQKKNWNLSESEYQFPERGQDNPYHQALIRQEASTLHRIMVLFDNEEAKTRLFTAFTYFLKIHEKDVGLYDTNYKTNKLLQLFSIGDKTQKSELFQILSTVVQIVEKKEKKSDAIRMWLNKQRKVAIKRLNMIHGKEVYDNEAFGLLFEYYYSVWLNQEETLQ